MQWRSFVMLSVGMTVVLLVSLLADPPYPRPVQVYASNSVRMRRPQPNQVILSMTNDFLYQTLIWYEMPLAGASSNGVVHGIGPMKTGVVGMYVCLCGLRYSGTDYFMCVCIGRCAATTSKAIGDIA